MKKTRARKKTASHDPAAGRRALEYKVVELSVVDEGSLESAVNDWARRGWTFDGVQFAMRESSKRPSMAFVFFTREGAVVEELEPAALVPRASPSRGTSQQSAWDRLKRLAGDDDL